MAKKGRLKKVGISILGFIVLLIIVDSLRGRLGSALDFNTLYKAEIAFDQGMEYRELDIKELSKILKTAEKATHSFLDFKYGFMEGIWFWPFFTIYLYGNENESEYKYSLTFSYSTAWIKVWEKEKHVGEYFLTKRNVRKLRKVLKPFYEQWENVPIRDDHNGISDYVD